MLKILIALMVIAIWSTAASAQFESGEHFRWRMEQNMRESEARLRAFQDRNVYQTEEFLNRRAIEALDCHLTDYCR
jgi:hypothetical protein